MNGLRLNDTQTGHNNLDIPFPFESVQRVEVLKGAGSTLYGSDAMGGAVNFITAVPDHSEIRLGAGIGNFGTDQQNGALTLARIAIVTSGHEAGNESGFGLWLKLTSLRATQKQNFILLHSDVISRQSPRIVEGAERLCVELERVRGRR